MKQTGNAVSIVLSILILSWSGPAVYARAGHGGGGFSGGAGGHASGAGHSFGGGSYSGGGGYHSGGGHTYSGATHSSGGSRQIYGSRSSGYSSSHWSSKYSSAGTPRSPYSATKRTPPPAATGSRATWKPSGGTASHGSVISGTGSTVKAGGVGGAPVTPSQGSVGAPGRANPATFGSGSVTSGWARQNPANIDRFNWQTRQKLGSWHGRVSSYNEAQQRHHGHHHHHHDHQWWRHHCQAIVLVGWGYWGWDDGWWYPAWGYDPSYSYYEYDGPIYGFDALPPDEAVATVQNELQRLGYYSGPVDGILGPATQAGLRQYQHDNGLQITGAIDVDTVRSLRLD